MTCLRGTLLLGALLGGTPGCSVLPRELNLAPVWFHRLDTEGKLLECDALWPIVHYERTAAGGSDLRIRPLYRRVTEPLPDAADRPAADRPSPPPSPNEAVEHQFLWPFGRGRSDGEESHHRLWPLWSWRSRSNEAGLRDVDWYLLFPLVWGGSGGGDGRGGPTENYFGIFPFYADLPDFLTYRRFTAVLFPLYLRLEKQVGSHTHRHTMFLWPLVGTSACEGGHSRWHFYPFYGHDVQPGRHDRRFALWPFFAWGTENLAEPNSRDLDDLVHSYWFWPFCGWRTGRTVGGWTALWPFFQHTWKQDHFNSLSLFWPFVRYYWNRAEDNVTQRWFWPLVGQVQSDDQRAWSFAWPLVWWREFDDPEGHTAQQYVLPFWWHLRTDTKDHRRDDHWKAWPFAHHTVVTDAAGANVSADWSVPSPFPFRHDKGLGQGWREHYGFLWELLRYQERQPGDRAFDLAGRLFTRRAREGGSTASMPFLFNYERDRSGARTLRLLQFLPIPLGGGPAPEVPR
ncbi:MAG: hypothetical protein JNK49_11765 [Planctomycetes bacterium]|nr:hypothetical protein [Planctomycetota bacterium]